MHSTTIKRKILSILRNKKIDCNNIILYTYWLNESSLGCEMVKLKFPGIKVISRVHSSELYLNTSSIGYHPFKKKK